MALAVLGSVLLRSAGCANVIYRVGKRWSVSEYDYVSELGQNGYPQPSPRAERRGDEPFYSVAYSPSGS
eukprot:7035361-Prymnesium_polylepis.1